MQYHQPSTASSFSLLGHSLGQVARALRANDPAGLQGKAATGMFHAAIRAGHQNAWFTPESVMKSLEAISFMLRPRALEQWLKSYGLYGGPNPSGNSEPGREESGWPTGVKKRIIGSAKDGEAAQAVSKPGKEIPAHRVLVIMAGNIPLVGFHDMLCVLASGHNLLGKLSSHDTELPVALGRLIKDINPDIGSSIQFVEGAAKGFDMVIATGSNNTSRYFGYYFGKYPHIIRRNRTSLAVLSGNETPEEMRMLGDDIFSYFGLGCRNVSMLWVPETFDLQLLTGTWHEYGKLTIHSKYMNNYDYQKAVMMVNQIPFIDTGFCLLKENQRLHSPLAVVHYQRYRHISEVHSFLQQYQDDLQCIVAGKKILEGFSKQEGFPKSLQNGSVIRPGSGQTPELWDYADGVDTMRFLID